MTPNTKVACCNVLLLVIVRVTSDISTLQKTSFLQKCPVFRVMSRICNELTSSKKHPKYCAQK